MMKLFIACYECAATAPLLAPAGNHSLCSLSHQAPGLFMENITKLGQGSSFNVFQERKKLFNSRRMQFHIVVFLIHIFMNKSLLLSLEKA